MSRTAKQITGQMGEDAAVALLRSKGFRILKRNWRKASLELDIVAEEGDTLVFVEVKTRAQGGLTRPHEALTPAKRATLSKAATHYLMEHDCWHRPCRFDLVSVLVRDQHHTAEHMPNVFDFTPALAGRNAAWQPW